MARAHRSKARHHGLSRHTRQGPGVCGLAAVRRRCVAKPRCGTTWLSGLRRAPPPGTCDRLHVQQRPGQCIKFTEDGLCGQGRPLTGGQTLPQAGNCYRRACFCFCFFLFFFDRTFLSPIHAVPVRSPSPKLTAGWPHGVGKVHDTRPAGLAGGPSPPRREAAGDRAVWPIALFGEEIAEGWDRAIDVGCAMQGSRLERGSKGTGGRESQSRTTAVNRRWHNWRIWRGGALVQTAPGCERGAEHDGEYD